MKNRNLKHSDNWETPRWLYKKLNEEFKFNCDPCPLNHKPNQINGLFSSWGSRAFVNPPYSLKLKEAFVKKAIEESKKGKLCVCLLPVSTSTKLFHDHILPNKKEIRFLRGRVKFKGDNTKGVYVENNSGMHDSMIVIFKAQQPREEGGGGMIMRSDDKELVEFLSEEVHKAYCKYKKEQHGEEYWTKGDYSLLDDKWKEADRYTVRAVLDYLEKICLLHQPKE